MNKSFSILLCLLAILTLDTNAPAQGFEAPVDSNAVVYFVRVSKSFDFRRITFFHESKFIGKFGGVNCMRYECPAGKNLFWASTENKNFLNCELKAGGTYIVLLNLSMSGLDLEPITTDNPDFNRISSVVNSKKCYNESPEVIDEQQAEFDRRGVITRNLKKYKKKWKHSHFTKTITPDMAIPEPYLR